MVKAKITIVISFILLFSGCNASEETQVTSLNNKIFDHEREIESLNKRIVMLNEEIFEKSQLIITLNEELQTLRNAIQTSVVEIDKNDFTIPTTLEEAIEIMDRLQIRNVVLEHITIGDEIFTVVEVRERRLTVGLDGETVIYSIPDKSGNVLKTLGYRQQIQATMIAIIEEPSQRDFGAGFEHWVKIRMEDGNIGWVRGEYTSMDIGGIKYLTHRNIWLEENYARHLR